MKRIVCTALGMVLLAGSLFAADKYADLTNTLRDTMEVVDEFVDALNAAGSGEQVAAAVDTYADKMEELEPRLEAIEEKYPEINDTKYPEELAEVMEEYSGLGEKMAEAMNVLMQYMMDPAVQEAMERM